MSEPLLTLFCLPYAGAGAAVYRAWPALLPGSVAVSALELPGRGVLARRKPWHEWPLVLEELTQAAQAHLADLPPNRPFAIFGHSMGGATRPGTRPSPVRPLRPPAGLARRLRMRGTRQAHGRAEMAQFSRS